MSLTNLESLCLHHVCIYASLQEYFVPHHCVLIQSVHISHVHLRMCSKVHQCGMEDERVWFLGSATKTTKYPLQEHNYAEHKLTDHIICFLNRTDKPNSHIQPHGKNKMVSCAKVRYEINPENGDSMSLTNLES